ncbi:MAG: hypothetical protein FJZ01_10865 [Candidatus Sericytochromatia bacterium]|nr:hypothetical protein [Candidatus Tanganyikabacteria bacterium]
MAIQAVSAARALPQLRRDGGPEKPPVPSNFGPKKGPTFGDVAKITGKTAAGGALGYVSTLVYDLFFHAGNNGGKFYGGGVYATFAALGAAIGAWLGIRKYQQNQAAGK